ncbi:hypothetical protein F5B22DRAFT_641660 [Xylaria bambusicola]|uniref:uncharacterized protein n=1 Tax=Xylaria bambusicola TaxID=326684 RepID=UPI0020078CA5|nr:uncharacterized protein F5B22DRAFT_641660 [Xylaria bambusicola]KAI0526518.1 hypothetical protein F5B22DRAFT_641660 [Xylaria bambusicola]
MDPFSALNLLSDTIYKGIRVYDWICTLREASDDIHNARNGISNHLILLRRVRQFVRSDGQFAPQLAFLAERNELLEEANRAIVELLDLVGGDASTNNPLDREPSG